MSGGYKQLNNNAYAYREPPTLDVGKIYAIDDDETDEVPLFQQNKTIIRIDEHNTYSERSSSSNCFAYSMILFVTFVIVFGALVFKHKWDQKAD